MLRMSWSRRLKDVVAYSQGIFSSCGTPIVCNSSVPSRLSCVWISSYWVSSLCGCREDGGFKKLNLLISYHYIYYKQVMILRSVTICLFFSLYIVNRGVIYFCVSRIVCMHKCALSCRPLSISYK